MGAGASTISGDSNAQLAAELAVNASLPVSKITAEVKEFAVRLKTALSTEDGWKELQQLFKSLRPSLDEEVSSSEWGSMVYQDEGLRVKYFGDLSPEEIAAHFNGLDEECAHSKADHAHSMPHLLCALLTLRMCTMARAWQRQDATHVGGVCGWCSQPECGSASERRAGDGRG